MTRLFCALMNVIFATPAAKTAVSDSIQNDESEINR